VQQRTIFIRLPDEQKLYLSSNIFHMLKKSFFALSIVTLVLLSSCKDKSPEDTIKEEVTMPAKVSIRFKPMWHDQDFVMQNVYFDDFGNRIRIDKFMHYISFITLRKDDGTDVVLKDFHLANFYNDNSFEFEVPAGNYNKLKFGIGIPEEYNKDQDPAQYASSNPLSVAGSQGMFWTWNTGYIFVKFEGMADTTGTEGAELLHPVAIHIGDDPLYRRYGTPEMDIAVVKGQTTDLTVKIHVDQILSTGGASDIDFATDAITHTSNNLVLATTFMDNYLQAITVE
jgi:hypothetical protein